MSLLPLVNGTLATRIINSIQLVKGLHPFYGHYNGAIDYYSHLRDGNSDWHKDYKTSYDVGYSTDLIGSEVVRFISNTDESNPFFAYVAFNAPHSSYASKIRRIGKI